MDDEYKEFQEIFKRIHDDFMLSIQIHIENNEKFNNAQKFDLISGSVATLVKKYAVCLRKDKDQIVPTDEAISFLKEIIDRITID